MSIFSKIFKKNKVVQNSLDLVNINNFIVYPDESFYEEKENKPCPASRKTVKIR